MKSEDKPEQAIIFINSPVPLSVEEQENFLAMIRESGGFSKRERVAMNFASAMIATGDSFIGDLTMKTAFKLADQFFEVSEETNKASSDVVRGRVESRSTMVRENDV